ncbi:Kinesin-associated protein [Toxoplasma gondii MAS]|uniref:Kinesin-associated protein n=1 Tax=Toxoplasma gondii MAS TaxID=943118 RepID=A0A086QY73_TOXGO|nr:Kinesin-associated protein [Toxoplasma gondii MAS]
MVKRGIIPLLVDSLNRKQRHLVHVCISFLWKLSVMNKNKDEIVKCGFLSKATHLLQTFLEKTSCTAPTITVLLKTLYNLSFDPAIAADMVDCGILSRVADLVAIPAVRPAAIRVLYQLTIEARGSSLLTFHKSGIPLLLDIAAATPKDACLNE